MKTPHQMNLLTKQKWWT